MKYNPDMTSDLIRLRDELANVAFDSDGYTIDTALAPVVFKINSVLYGGYPRKKGNTNE